MTIPKVESIRHIIIEHKRFKTFLMLEKSVNSLFFYGNQEWFSDDTSLFFAEMFSFWLAAIEDGSSTKDSLISYARSNNIPVIDYDKNDLSSFGNEVFSIWKAALNKS